ncbi:hypothetical protein FCN77_15105 [Arthrobacter sp. 24S4-2]|uniref:hypothetical protein n=1 Tax=Arthrobacter sp. 24S4-2 TaxID=2575374 RepID=UPI0010C7CEF3|nr:hypothetical protein [Arthrobacter sp. 24S4-2]QCO98783.1 hypothetical protein FCN77_15105 [Arthrobacter sp. 24S4-2]
MRRSTSRRNKYPSHWPVHVTGLAEAWQPLPQPVTAIAGQALAPAHPAGDGELTASPWIGLHYASEGT